MSSTTAPYQFGDTYRGTLSGESEPPEVTYTSHPDWAWVASLSTEALHTQFPLQLDGVNLGFEWGRPAPTEVRHAQVSFDQVANGGRGMRWGVAAGFPSEPELVARGFFGAGSGLDLSHLSEADRHLTIYSLLQPKDRRRQPGGWLRWIEKKSGDSVLFRNPLHEIESVILASCPRFGAFPVIDFDCFESVSEVEKNRVVLAFKEEAQSYLGVDPQSFSARDTGGKGRHVGIRIDPRFRHTHLYEIVREQVLYPLFRRRPGDFRVYLADRLPKKRSERIDPVMIDDSIMVRAPSSRGGQWRALGCPRPDGSFSRYVDDSGHFLPVTGLQDRDLFLSYDLLVQAERRWREGNFKAKLEGRARKKKDSNRPKVDRSLKDVDHLTDLKETAAWTASRARLAGPHDLRLAMSAALLSLGFQDVAIANVLAAATGNLDDARECVNSTRDRVQSGGSVKSLPWIRRTLGSEHVMELAYALAKDTGKPAFDLIVKVLGRDKVRGESARFMLQCWDNLEGNTRSKFESAFKRPGGCSIYANEGRTLDSDKPVFFCPLRCEGKTCPFCAVSRAHEEGQLLAELWKDRGPFYFTEIYGIDNLQALDEFLKRVSRSAVPKLTVKGFKNGKPSVMFATDDAHAIGRVVAFARRAVKRMGMKGASVSNSAKLFDKDEAIDRVMQFRLTYHLHGRDLMERRDEKGMVEFMIGSHRKQLVTRSKRGLPWPTKEQLKVARKKDVEDNLDYEGQEVEYNLVHMATKYVLATRSYPYTIDQAMSIAERHSGFKQHVRQSVGLPSLYKRDAGGKVRSIKLQGLSVPIPA